MPVYNAPEIKDRVATGDDLYTITDVDGKKKLTPAPTEVTEPGTAINKALMQDIVDALQGATGTLVPYELHWWKRRAKLGSYAELRSTAFGSSSGNTSLGYSYSILPFFYAGEGESYNSSVSFQAASLVTINQSTGAVSLNNPTSRTIKYADYTSIQNICAGKYIKFTSDAYGQSNDKIMYVPSDSYVKLYSVASSVTGPTRDYIGYLSPNGNWGTWGPGTDVQIVTSAKSTTTGDWELISSNASDAYPHSGTSGGYEYVYFGTVADKTLSNNNPLGFETITLTTANLISDGESKDSPSSSITYQKWHYDFSLPYTRCVLGIPSMGMGASSNGSSQSVSISGLWLDDEINQKWMLFTGSGGFETSLPYANKSFSSDGSAYGGFGIKLVRTGGKLRVEVQTWRVSGYASVDLGGFSGTINILPL